MPKFMGIHTLPPGSMTRQQINQMSQAAQQNPVVKGYRSFVAWPRVRPSASSKPPTSRPQRTGSRRWGCRPIASPTWNWRANAAR